MKYYFLLFSIFLSFFHSDLFAQTKLIDSLSSILKTPETADTSKAKILIELAWDLKYSKPKEARKYAEEGVELSKKTHRYREVATGLKILGIINDQSSNFKESVDYYLSSIGYYKKIGDTLSIARVESNIGKIYLGLHQNREAILYFERCLPVFEKANFALGINLINQNLGTAYYNLTLYDSALFHFTRSLEYIGSDSYYDGNIYGNIGNCYFKKKDYNKAELYVQKCVKIFMENGDSSTHLYHWKSMLGMVYLNTGRVSEAIKEMEECVKGHKRLGLYYTSHNSVTLKNLAIAEAKSKRYDLAYTNLLDVIRINDTIFNMDFSRTMNEMKEKYEADKKEQELRLVKLEQEKERELAVLENNRQRIFIFFILAITIGLGVIAIVVFRSLRITKEQKQLIEQQKLMVDESQRKVIASINYAKKIQTSMLPSNEDIASSFKDIAVFFKPKDIVSGDFYWFHHEHQISYLAVADCTGHGVPGAFMTMIAQAILNDVVVKQKITDPSEILNHLHSLIFKALKQHKGDEYSQDGMDISFAKINHGDMTITFAGARNNAFVFADGQVQTLKATAKSIGGLSLLGEVEPDRKFKEEIFQLKMDSVLILTTDGVFDQLNDQDEKYGINRFKEMILQLDTSNFEKATEYFDENFCSWKGSTPQLDDVLLMAVKF
jgi:serine phosphatase RsbU (regulator of sigma subunit)